MSSRRLQLDGRQPGHGRAGPLTVTLTITSPISLPMSLASGGTVQIQSVVKDGNGIIISGSTPDAWHSSDNAIATVNSTGLVTAVAPGSANITASLGAITSNALAMIVTPVVDVTPASITVTPATMTLAQGIPQPASATIKNAAGTPVSATPTSWVSSDPTKATVSATGVVTWVAAGSANITARYNAIVSNACAVTANVSPDVTPAVIVVTPATMALVQGAPQPATASIRNAAGTVLGLSPTSWTSSDVTKATVDANGVVTWIAQGTTNVAAHYNAIVSNNCAVTAAAVIDVTPASVTVSPTTLSLVTGAPQQLTAVIKNAAGTALALTPSSWTSSDPTKATVNSSGLVTWAAAGTTNVAAHYSALDSNNCVVTAAVDVNTVPTSVTVSPTTLTLQNGAPQTLSAVIKNVSGVALALTPTSWTSSDPTKATVNSSGVVTWVAAGSTNVTANYNAIVSNTCVVTVAASVDLVAASVTVAPTTMALPQGSTSSCTASIKNAAGDVLGLSPTSWTTSDPTHVTVDANGVVTWVGQGNAYIAAHYNALVSNNCTVTAAAAGGSPLYPNEPAGFTPLSPLLTCDTLPPTQDVYVPGSANDIGWINSGGVSKVVDTTSPVGSTNVLSVAYPAGMTGGVSPGFVYSYQFPNNPQNWPLHPRRLYTSYWYKLSLNFPINLNGNKMVYLEFGSPGGGNAFGQFALFMTASSAILNDNGTVVFGPDGSATPYTAAILPCFAVQGSITINGVLPNNNDIRQFSKQMFRGQWHHIEAVVDINTPGNQDGAAQMWLDGVRIVSLANIGFGAGAPTAWQWAQWVPVYGGGGSVPLDAVNATHELKNFYFSGQA